MWMSEARSWIAWVIEQVDVPTIGRVVDDLADLGEVFLFLGRVEDGGEIVQLAVGAVVPVDGREHVCLRGDDGSDLGLTTSPDVVDGQHVGRVGHRERSSRPSSKPIGRTVYCRQTAAGTRATAERSTGWSVSSTKRMPICWASAATSWDSLSTPWSTSTRPSARPARCCSA